MFGEKVHGQLSRKAEALSLPGLCSECPKRARFESPKAAERIAIKMGVVTEQPIRRWLLVAGEVEDSPAAQKRSTSSKRDVIAAGEASQSRHPESSLLLSWGEN